MLVIDIIFFILELGVGITVGSLALMADAFHMLNDIISLVVGLWAVKAAQKSSNDKYSFGWLRAEILGAFFNAVFLIALCLSIILEAITRFLDPPEVLNPKLILIVGSVGLFSNLVGFFVLGGHGHSHGPAEHDHDHDHDHAHNHDEQYLAEEGRSDGPRTHTHDAADENGRVGDVLPTAVIPRVTRSNSRASGGSARDKKIRFTHSDETASTSRDSDPVSVSLGRYGATNNVSKPPAKYRYQQRRSSSIASRLTPDISIHPASFRQDIIDASRTSLDQIPIRADGDSSDDSAIVDEPTEHSPLRGFSSPDKKTNGKGFKYSSIRRDSVHENHNHNKPKKASKGGHSHNHGDMGMRAMVLHVIGDALGNVGVIVSALIIWLTDSPGRFYADPAVSLFITLIILRSCIPLTSATAKILLQATPDHIDVNDIKEDIQSIPGIISCHHVHIWQLSDSQIIASMHIQVGFSINSTEGAERYMTVAKAVRKCLHAYGIHSATVQPEFCTDMEHNHVAGNGLHLDGVASRGADGDSCLLECVDDCQGKMCCAKSPPTSIHSHDDEHEHEAHGHGHSH